MHCKLLYCTGRYGKAVLCTALHCTGQVPNRVVALIWLKLEALVLPCTLHYQLYDVQCELLNV